MAGVKGRSGGRRPGAGRPKGSKNRIKEPVTAGSPPTEPPVEAPSAPVADPVEHDSLSYLRTVINDSKADRAIKVRAAIALAQYEHQKIADGGVKPKRQLAADKAGQGRFAPSPAPTLKRVA